MVVSSDPLATQAGVEILQAGGNAVDAAVAVGFALAVSYPFAGNIGGGGFMMVRMAGEPPAMIDYREEAPGHATRCVDGPYVRHFEETRARLEAAGKAADAVWAELEELNLGRLRIAAIPTTLAMVAALTTPYRERGTVGTRLSI